MKKLAIIAFILLALMLVLIACDSEKKPDEASSEGLTETDSTLEASAADTPENPEDPTEQTEELTDTSVELPTSEVAEPPLDTRTEEASDDPTETPSDEATHTSAETLAEETTPPLEIPEKETSFAVTFASIYTQNDKGTLYDGKLKLEEHPDAAYFSGVRKNDWMEFLIHTAKAGEYSVCMVLGEGEALSTYTVYVDGYKAATLRNKVSVTDPNTPTDSTATVIHLTEGLHTVRVVMDSDSPDLYGARFALTRENLALNKPISSDGAESSQKEACYANDGDPLTKWSAGSNQEENLIIDLEDFYTLDKIAFLFDNSMGEYSISVSKDGSDYTVVCNGAASPAASSAFMKEYHLNGVIGRYVKITHTVREDAAEQMFSIYEIYLYGEVHVIPPTPEFYDDYKVPHSVWTVSGHCTGVVGREGHGLSGMVAAGGVESGGLLHQGAVGVGKIDLSKYDKVIVYYGLDNSSITHEYYNANPYNRIMLTKEDTDGIFSPDQSVIIASATYQRLGWSVVAIEIDLTNINYNGPVYVTYDTLPGTFMLIGDIEFIGGEKK